MAKLPLTKEGVDTKLRELYALPQKDLDTQAFEIATDFKQWIGDSFDLTTDEQNYLRTADDDFVRLLSSVIFAGVRNRLPLKFTPPKSIKAAKRFDTKSQFNFNYLWGGKLDKTTELDLEIYYE